MESAQPITKITTEFTCWKCGEESLTEAARAGVTRGANGDVVASIDVRHSVCEKCGTYSVNPAQALHNKNVSRKSRKALIRESNRTSA